MGLRVPFALVPFGFNSPIKFIIYTSVISLINSTQEKFFGRFKERLPIYNHFSRRYNDTNIILIYLNCTSTFSQFLYREDDQLEASAVPVMICLDQQSGWGLQIN